MNVLKLYSYAYSTTFSNESVLMRFVSGRWIKVELDDLSYYRFRLEKIGSEYYGCVRYCSNHFGHTLPSSSSLVVMFQNIYDWITR